MQLEHQHWKNGTLARLYVAWESYPLRSLRRIREHPPNPPDPRSISGSLKGNPRRSAKSAFYSGACLDELHLDGAWNYPCLISLCQQQRDGLAASLPIVERIVVDVHSNELVG